MSISVGLDNLKPELLHMLNEELEEILERRNHMRLIHLQEEVRLDPKGATIHAQEQMITWEISI